MFITVQNAKNIMRSYWDAIADYVQIVVNGTPINGRKRSVAGCSMCLIDMQ